MNPETLNRSVILINIFWLESLVLEIPENAPIVGIKVLVIIPLFLLNAENYTF